MSASGMALAVGLPGLHTNMSLTFSLALASIFNIASIQDIQNRRSQVSDSSYIYYNMQV